MADIIAGGTSPPSYEEAISDLPTKTERALNDEKPSRPDDTLQEDAAPSAPPLTEIADQVDDQERVDIPPAEVPPQDQVTAAANSSEAQNNQKQYSTVYRLIRSYIGFSVAQKIRVYIEPNLDQPDPELDYVPQGDVASTTEAIEKRGILQCISGWTWCIGGLQVALYIAVLIAMLITGVVADVRDKCLFNSGRITAYLLVGGSLLLLVTIFRIFPSTLTCCKNRNICNSKKSLPLFVFICVLEGMFYIVMVTHLAILITGTVWIFEEKPTFCQNEESANVPTMNTPVTDESNVSAQCCDRAVYVASAIVNIFLYILHAFSVAYLFLAGVCIKRMAAYKLQ